MDELLALFEENPAEQAAPTSSSGIVEPAQQKEKGFTTKKEYVRRPKGNEISSKRNEEKPKRSEVWTDADHQVGFRITKRLVSSIDLTDMLSTCNFHTTSSLCAMSLKQRNALLVDPAQVIDKTTVAGRTNLMTVGIVFSNPGTRITKSGNAFLIVSLGSLRTGPSVSVMLFGSVYGKFCKKLVPGTAVAIMSPRLVPPKDDYSSATSITFSLNDENQIVLLGQAQDFGVCKAKIRGKNERGIWTDDARRCKNWVDTSVCEYCQTHRSQRNNGSKKAAASQSRIEDFRRQDKFGMAHHMSRNGRTLTLPAGQKLVGNSRFTNMSATGAGGWREAGRQAIGATQTTQKPTSVQNEKSIQLTHRSTTYSLITRGNVRSRGILRPESTPLAAPSLAPTQTSKPHQERLSSGSIRNPYSSAKSMPVVTPTSTRQVPSRKTTKEVDLATIISGQKRKKETSKEPSKVSKAKMTRLINTDTADFDGSVPVPKPRGRMASAASIEFPKSGLNAQSSINKVSTILDKQREMISKIRTREEVGNDKVKSVKVNTRNKSPVIPDQTGWCAPLLDTERERLRNLKSSFAREADAEAFALSRSRIVELEKEEEKKQTHNGKAKQSTESKHIRKMWKCVTCDNRTFAHYPKKCYMDQHNVVVVRELREDPSREQKRSALSSKKAEEGGLKLGSGLEWSWSRFS
jgi:hypothetical protein